MKVKKYIARTMPEAMNLIRKDLGPDAVILNSKEIRQGGFLGFFQKTKLEVFAILDESPLEISKNDSGMNASLKENEPAETFQQPANNQQNQQVLKELNALKNLLKHQHHINHYGDRLLSEYQAMHTYLLEQEVSESLTRQIIMNVMTEQHEKHIEPMMENIYQQTKSEIMKYCKALSFEGINYSKQIVHFVGPTGVGKTTTLAKVAAKCLLTDQKTVAFISTDTYRIAAIDQLKTYAKILNVPLEVAYSNQDYQQAIEKFSEYDLILVDTPGRNFRDRQYIEEMKDSIYLNEKIETYLVLSLTAKPKDLQDIQKQFQTLNIKEIIFTKLDETTQFGSILSIASEMGTGIAYLTNGQDVPDDLVIPNQADIADLILGGFNHA